MSRAVILVHGIHTDKERAEAWGSALGARIIALAAGGLIGVHLYEYGWLSGTAIRFPWVGGAVREHEVARFQAWVADIARRYGPDVSLDAIGYSFGSYLVGHSMTDAPGPRSFWRKVGLMGCILSSRDDWSDKAGHYESVLNLWSHEDEIVRFSTFGQAGWKGFVQAPAAVQNFETDSTHGDYEQPGPAWKALLSFMAS